MPTKVPNEANAAQVVSCQFSVIRRHPTTPLDAPRNGPPTRPRKTGKPNEAKGTPRYKPRIPGDPLCLRAYVPSCLFLPNEANAPQVVSSQSSDVTAGRRPPPRSQPASRPHGNQKTKRSQMGPPPQHRASLAPLRPFVPPSLRPCPFSLRPGACPPQTGPHVPVRFLPSLRCAPVSSGTASRPSPRTCSDYAS
jgi:hypothetical protein